MSDSNKTYIDRSGKIIELKKAPTKWSFAHCQKFSTILPLRQSIRFHLLQTELIQIKGGLESLMDRNQNLATTRHTK